MKKIFKKIKCFFRYHDLVEIDRTSLLVTIKLECRHCKKLFISPDKSKLLFDYDDGWDEIFSLKKKHDDMVKEACEELNRHLTASGHLVVSVPLYRISTIENITVH